MLRELREQTRDLHERVERAVVVLSPDLDRSTYLSLLERFYGFYVVVEDRLVGGGACAVLPFDFEVRRKVPLLVADLAFLGVPVHGLEALPKIPDPPDLDGVYEMLGCCYVLEGATLGGRLSARHLERTLGLGPASGASFFASYGERVAMMWVSFREALESFPGIEEHREEVIGAARATFLAFERWLAPTAERRA